MWKCWFDGQRQKRNNVVKWKDLWLFMSHYLLIHLYVFFCFVCSIKRTAAQLSSHLLNEHTKHFFLWSLSLLLTMESRHQHKAGRNVLAASINTIPLLENKTSVQLCTFRDQVCVIIRAAAYKCFHWSADSSISESVGQWNAHHDDIKHQVLIFESVHICQSSN